MESNKVEEEKKKQFQSANWQEQKEVNSLIFAYKIVLAR